MTNATPSINPANNSTLVGALKTAIRKTLEDLECAFPAEVVSFTRSDSGDRVSVTPQILTLATNGESTTKAQITNIPVMQDGGGGFVVSFPLDPGDKGWIIACDRDISLFTQAYTEQKPNTNRVHDFSDSFFIPDAMTGIIISGEDQANLVIQKLDGSVKISLSDDEIKIVTPTKITMQSPEIELDADVTITGTLDVEGDTMIDGNLDVTSGDIDTDGDINADGKCVIQGDIASGGDITAAGSITPNTPIPP